MAMTFMSKKSGMDRSAVILGMDRTAFVRASKISYNFLL